MIPLRRSVSLVLGPLSTMCALALCLALSMGGCGDDDDPLGPEDGPPPLRQDTPQNTLSALVHAYTTRDSTRTKAVYDSTYTGTSADLNDPGSPLSFTYDDEVRHVAALARTPGLTAFVDFGPQVTWTRLPSDDPSHPEWAMIQISGSSYRIEITDGPNTFGAVGEPGSFQEFAFSPYPDSTSQTDTLWRVVRWREVGAGAGAP